MSNAPFVSTYSDVIEAMEDFMSSIGIASHQRVIRHAIGIAYREIVSARDWNCMIRNHRIHLHAAQTEGTVAYDHTGGTYERQVTLTGSTWPSWAKDASVYLNNVVCDVEDRKSDTVITLDQTMNPGADVAAGSEYTIYPRWYALPSGFVSLATTIEEASWLIGEEIDMSEMAQRQRYDFGTGDIRWYAVGAVPDLYGSMGLFVHYPSNADEPLDLVCKIRPRNIRYSGQDAADYAGTISVSSGSANVIGSGTSFASGHVGSILRISANTTKPSSVEGSNPYVEQRSIISVDDATNLTLDAVVETTRSSVKYVISDPIDLDISLWSAFLRNCEKQLVSGRDVKNAGAVIRAASDALFAAKCEDGRSTQRIICGGSGRRPLRLHDYGTVGEDVE